MQDDSKHTLTHTHSCTHRLSSKRLNRGVPHNTVLQESLKRHLSSKIHSQRAIISGWLVMMHDRCRIKFRNWARDTVPTSQASLASSTSDTPTEWYPSHRCHTRKKQKLYSLVCCRGSVRTWTVLPATSLLLSPASWSDTKDKKRRGWTLPSPVFITISGLSYTWLSGCGLAGWYVALA